MKYSVIYLDPPWQYNDRKLIRLDGKVPKAGTGAGNHYHCMSNADMAAIEIPVIAADNCAMFMWVTGPHLFSPQILLDGWNAQIPLKKNQFRYCNIAFVWQKITVNGKTFPGRGHWGFHSSEIVLLYMKGSLPVKKTVHEEIRVMHPRGADGKIIHSRKPAIVRDRIVEIFGDLPRIELFATEKTDGWGCTGYDVDGKDIRDFLREQKGDLALDWRQAS